MTNRTTQLGRIFTQLGLAAMYCSALPAGATTTAEEKLFHAPMPHEKLGARAPLTKVHRIRLQGNFEGFPSNTLQLEQLKEHVHSCITNHQFSESQSHPPMQWPDFMLSVREDRYFAVNRSIRYESGIVYRVNYADCSLAELASSTASLVSSEGVCHIDLIKKTATGVCAAGAHTKASTAPVGHHNSIVGNPALRAMANTPRGKELALAAQNAQAANDTRTGRRKTVAGLECDIWNLPAFGEGATFCLARGGSFTASRTSGNPGEAGLLLEYETPWAVKMRAVEAKLDDEVSSSVFEPHLAGDFSIISSKRHK